MPEYEVDVVSGRLKRKKAVRRSPFRRRMLRSSQIIFYPIVFLGLLVVAILVYPQSFHFSGPEGLIFRSAVPLNQERISALSAKVVAGSCFTPTYYGSNAGTPPACAGITDLVRSGRYRVAECQYGPVRNDGQGFRSFVVWIDAVPENIRSYSVPRQLHPFSYLGKKAVHACPQTMDEMTVVFNEGRLVEGDW